MNPTSVDRRLGLSPEQIEMIMSGHLTPAEAFGVDRRGLLEIAARGYHALAGGVLDNALVIFQGLSVLQPEDPIFRYYLGATYVAMGLHEEALPHYDAALERDPRSVDALAGRGELLLLLQRPHDALADLDRAIAVDAGKMSPSAMRAASTRRLLKAAKPLEARRAHRK